ncbi:2-oxo acid dehydrogenase subunit E2 [Streptomyces humidus]|uniref:2-oxo acid dehydrogenase subunit E2 n=1 Tax=Streptomyces humidus TaxID=52259 RepID=UPI00332EF790
MAEFTMPSLGADMEEGTLLEWLVGPGDPVHKGDPVAVVETAKSTIEVECFETGVMGRLLVDPGATVPVGTPLALIGPTADGAVEPEKPGSPRRKPGKAAKAGGPTKTGKAARSEKPEKAAKPGKAAKAAKAAKAGKSGEGEKAGNAEKPGEAEKPGKARKAEKPGKPPRRPTRPPPGREEPTGPAPSSPEPVQAPTPAPTPAPVPAPAAAARPGHLEAGPLARRIAERSGVDLETLPGSGPGGRVTRTDVERAAAGRGAARPPRVRATPFARRLAAELGVDLVTLTGTGKGSAVRAADVRRAAPGPAAEPAPARPDAASARPSAERVPSGRPAAAGPSEERASAMRQAIAGLMTRANRDIPHYYLSTTVDVAAAMDRMHEHNRRSPVGERLLPAALLLKAAALAAREVPELNGFWTDDRFTAGDGVHLGIAVSLRGGGLVAPALRDADSLALPQLMAALKDLVARARAGRLRGSEVSGATLTVTDLGDQGVETVFGVIHPPQVALVGFGRVVDRPCAVDGLLGVRPTVTATLAADHRATDGAVGARYLTAVTRLLQNPEEL